MSFIHISNWERFQHYKHREPPWIKVYTRLLDDDAYLNLTAPQRGVLHGLWLLYAKSHRTVPEDTAALSRRLGVRVTKETLAALNHAGFIEFVASAALAEDKQIADLETEREKRSKTSAVSGPSNGVPAEQHRTRRIRNLVDLSLRRAA